MDYNKSKNLNKETDIENSDTDYSGVLPYLDEERSFEERAADLVSRMTLEEKATQLKNLAAAIPRLGVSAYNYWREGLHGVARQGKATSFPTNISMSNTWNRELVFKAADITATEARGKNARTDLTYWSPTINLARDPRWGRNEETYGEDPYLTGEYAKEFVKGMQGDDDRYLKTAVTVKHLIANNCEKERRTGTSVFDEDTLRNYYARVFQNVVESAKPVSAMSSYNASTLYRNGEIVYDYVPSTSNSHILTGLLKRNWGFKGYVVGDCGAFEDLNNIPAYKKAMFPGQDIEKIPQSATVAAGLLSGADIDCGNAALEETILEAVELGYITENELNVNIYNMFVQRMRLGEFDKNPRYSDITNDILEIDEHIEVAEISAEESWVLLKNDDNILPLKYSIQNVAVVGSLADEVVLGDYSGSPEKITKPYEGIKKEIKKLNPLSTVRYIGGVTDDTVLMNIKSLKFVLVDGTTREIDLLRATNSYGFKTDNGEFQNVTRNGKAVIPDIDFSDVESVVAEIATGKQLGGKIKITYGIGGPQVATISSLETESLDIYEVCVAEYTGTSGGYNQVSDLCFTIQANTPDFSVDKYKSELDEADVIIAYAGTTLADSSESHDRNDIKMPESQAHVAAITKAYSQKTIVAMQTVGQIDVTDFESGAKAILWTSYNGQCQGTALGRILSGKAVPSGKLTTTWYTVEDLELMPLCATPKKCDDGITRYFNDYGIKTKENFPGRTYQYYKETPIYPFGFGLSYTTFEYANITVSKKQVESNETVTVSVDVKNIGKTKGAEVVQLYISYPQGDEYFPTKQLKGFDKITLKPGERKTVSIDVKIAELRFFSEKNQNVYVKKGEYTVYMSKNSQDMSMFATFEVVDGIERKLKTVMTIPNGIKLSGLADKDFDNIEPINSIFANLSIMMSDETNCDLKDADIEYKSENIDIAVVNKNGVVVSGKKEGVTTINVIVTVDGVTKSDFFPVTNSLEIKTNDNDKKSAKARLADEINSYTKEAYSKQNWQTVKDIYAKYISKFDEVVKMSELESIFKEALCGMQSVKMDNIKSCYGIKSENPNYIINNMIDYRTGGIEPYIATPNCITGTVTEENPYSGIKLLAYDESGHIIEDDSLVWQLEKLDSSRRKVAKIDRNTGELTLMSNGLIKVSAIDPKSLKCGEIILYVNLQIEGEYSDDGMGANLLDKKAGASGSLTRGNNVGSPKSYWMEYRGVKMDNLKSVTLRYSIKDKMVVTNISLDKNNSPDKLLATGVVGETGNWETWSEKILDVDSRVIANANLDENGLATIYVQTNYANLDLLKLTYEDINDEVPYKIVSVGSKKHNTLAVNLKYVGSDDKASAVLVSENGDNRTFIDITKSGVYDIGVSSSTEEMSLYVQKGVDVPDILSNKVTHRYVAPKDNEVVVYSASDPAYTVLFGNIQGEKMPEVNGITGYGAYRKFEKQEFLYTYNHKEYKFSTIWQGEKGSETSCCLYFKPKAPCVVNVIFNGNGGADREQYIVQNGIKLATGLSEVKRITTVRANIKDSSSPVFIYGADQNKNIYAIIVEYISDQSSKLAENEITIQTAYWGKGYARLTEDKDTLERKIWKSDSGTIWTEVQLKSFAESDLEDIPSSFKINSIVVNKDRVYAACNDGIILIITACQKCYKLKKVCNFDVERIDVKDGEMTVHGIGETAKINMGSLGSDLIEADEALALLSGGALLVDVRDPEEFELNHIDDSINVPLYDLESIKTYNKNTTFIFVCSTGTKSQIAVEEATKMGFEKVYNLGDIKKLI